MDVAVGPKISLLGKFASFYCSEALSKGGVL